MSTKFQAPRWAEAPREGGADQLYGHIRLRYDIISN